MMQPLAGDPGQKWRRLARCGALACTLATVLPFEHGRSLWGVVDQIANIALGSAPSKNWPILAFCCMAVPVFLAPPAYLLFCSAASIRTSGRRIGVDMLLFLIWTATALTPYLACFKQLPPRSRETETPIAIGISLLSAYLLVCGLSFLASRRARNTPLYVFSMGTLPLGISALAWTSFMMILVTEIVTSGGRAADITIFIDIMLGFFGSLAQLYGWRRWAHAVKQACAVQKVTVMDAQTVPAN